MACTDGEKKATNFTADASPTLDKIMVVADPATGELLRTTIDEWEKNAATRAIVNATPDLINGLITFDAATKEWQQTTIAELFQNLSTKATDDDSPELDAQLYYADATTGELKRLTISELFTRIGITVNTDGTGTIFNDPLSYGTPTELILSGGGVTVTKSYHSIQTEGAGPTDDLETILGGVDGQPLYLRASVGSNTVVVTNTGNIDLNLSEGNMSLNSIRDIIHLIWDASANKWFEVTRSNNGS